MIATPPRSRRELRRETRRREIVDVALDIVVRDGLTALTMPRLARELGVAVGGLYRYFEGKDRLVAALAFVGIQRFQAGLQQVLDSLPVDQEADVAALARLCANRGGVDPVQPRRPGCSSDCLKRCERTVAWCVMSVPMDSSARNWNRYLPSAAKRWMRQWPQVLSMPVIPISEPW